MAWRLINLLIRLLPDVAVVAAELMAFVTALKLPFEIADTKLSGSVPEGSSPKRLDELLEQLLRLSATTNKTPMHENNPHRICLFISPLTNLSDLQLTTMNNFTA
jgi:hypothetical protein